MSAPFECVAAIFGGVATHLLYFKHGERHAYPWRYVAFFLTASAVLGAFKWSRDGASYSVLDIASSTLSLIFLYLAGLVGSVGTYRLFFNPLNQFPGPFAARLSKLYFVYLSSDLRGHRQLHALHEKYGRYVRIGPNDLSIVEPDGMKVVLGANSKCTKSAWYGQDMPYISINTTRDRAAHDRRRRILAPAFSDKALRGYSTRLQKFHDLLTSQIDASAGKPMNVTKWFGYWGMDMMCDIVFNGSFNMLASGETHWALKVLGDGLHLQGFALPPWLYRVFATLPTSGSGNRGLADFAATQLDNRMQQQGKTAHPDMMQPLIEHYDRMSADTKRAMLPLLQGDSRMLIVAGSDTTSTTLVHMFYRFCKEPGLVDRLRSEVDPLVSDPSAISYSDIRQAQLLHGCINETLRVHYPGPSGFFRKTPPEGIRIGEKYIPGNTIIQMPPYVMGLGKTPLRTRYFLLQVAYNACADEEVYERCRDFVPERWFSKPEMVKHKDAFLPFLAGSESCIGKNLAFIQLAVVASQIILQFDVKFAPGEDGSRLVQESKDLGMLHPEGLNVVFTRRNSTGK
ncbi:cytochrome P450 [Purpureocillium lavendulum]|uniref:Cytochrome P450 n=1 Tax=Purpureocillium lavendulum TaxID=1247861 RepID=A0AB34FRQ8_9HYPO|nr:cytochrome P450 [Purpureocillium lavendulum]